MTAWRPLLLAASLPLAGAGCAGPRMVEQPAPPPADSAADQARREERLKLMQRYWLERTGAIPADGSRGALPTPGAPLSYPAGNYDGLLFAARVSDDPGLTEPVR